MQHMSNVGKLEAREGDPTAVITGFEPARQLSRTLDLFVTAMPEV